MSEKQEPKWFAVDKDEYAALKAELEQCRAELAEVYTCPSCNISTMSSSGARSYEEAMAPLFAERDALAKENQELKSREQDLLEANTKIYEKGYEESLALRVKAADLGNKIQEHYRAYGFEKSHYLHKILCDHYQKPFPIFGDNEKGEADE